MHLPIATLFVLPEAALSDMECHSPGTLNVQWILGFTGPIGLTARYREDWRPRRCDPSELSLDHLVRPEENGLRDRVAQGLGSLQIDDQLELRGLFDREVAWFRTP